MFPEGGESIYSHGLSASMETRPSISQDMPPFRTLFFHSASHHRPPHHDPHAEMDAVGFQKYIRAVDPEIPADASTDHLFRRVSASAYFSLVGLKRLNQSRLAQKKKKNKTCRSSHRRHHAATTPPPPPPSPPACIDLSRRAMDRNRDGKVTFKEYLLFQAVGAPSLTPIDPHDLIDSELERLLASTPPPTQPFL